MQLRMDLGNYTSMCIFVCACVYVSSLLIIVAVQQEREREQLSESLVPSRTGGVAHPEVRGPPQRAALSHHSTPAAANPLRQPCPPPPGAGPWSRAARLRARAGQRGGTPAPAPLGPRTGWGGRATGS